MLQIYNTLTRKKEEFKPQKGKQVSFYQCGPTVYWTQHIGNMRAMVLADLMRRSLEFLGYKAKFARNYTDVGHLVSDSDLGEDKMAKAAKREKLSPQEVAKKYIKQFEADVAALNCEPSTYKPRATEYIKPMQKMVQALLNKDYAYATDLAIYFNVAKAKNYNQLSGQDLAQNIADAGKGEVSDKEKKNAADFVLWFFKTGVHKNALQTWPYKFKLPGGKIIKGDGFPGWHLECSAMNLALFGPTVDIHMGGVEHIPVHHTNEIAQSESASGKKFVNYWLHNEHLNVDGGKMAKSQGTAYSMAEIKENGYNPLALRYFFLQAHYRSKQNFTWEALTASQSALENLRAKMSEIKNNVGAGLAPAHNNNNVGAGSKTTARVASAFVLDFRNKFVEAIKDDFNIPQALALVWEVLKSDLPEKEKLAVILDFDKVLGLDLKNIKIERIPAVVVNLADERLKARQEKDWQKSDQLRGQIEAMGFKVEDRANGYNLKKI